MQFKYYTAVLFACMIALVAAAPVPVVLPPLDEESRDILTGDHVVEVARSPSPGCGKYYCT